MFYLIAPVTTRNEFFYMIGDNGIDKILMLTLIDSHRLIWLATRFLNDLIRISSFLRIQKILHKRNNKLSMSGASCNLNIKLLA